MRTLSAVLLVALCACSSTDPNDKRVRPEIQIVELYGPSDLRYARGQNTLDAEYGFRIANRSQEEITLRRIDLSSTGSGAGFHRVTSSSGKRYWVSWQFPDRA